MKKQTNSLAYIAKNLFTVLGLVLVWRGVWYILDGLDYVIFGDVHIWSAIIGTILGLLILYLPDKDLKEIEKL